MTSEKVHRNLQSRYRFATHGRRVFRMAVLSGDDPKHQKKHWRVGFRDLRYPMI